MNQRSWLETYRGTVYRWEVDIADHFTVAYYFARFEDATHAVLHAVGLDPLSLEGSGQACVTVDGYVRYRRELRVADVLHIRSGVVGVDDDGLRLVHEVIDSVDDTVCSTFEQGVALVDRTSRTRRSLTSMQREAALARRVETAAVADGQPASPVPKGDEGRPKGDEGFMDAARDTVKPSEVNVIGEAGMAAYIHRFSAANAQVLAAFGMTPAYCRQERRAYSTFEFRLSFPGALRAGDPVLVRTALLHVGNSSIRILHRMANARTNEPVATLEQAGVHLDLDARRPAPLPAPLRDRALQLLVRR
jgi:acyl-CoA thioester hydrolase